MINTVRNRRRKYLMYQEINQMCAKYEDECRFLGSHQETEEEKMARLKRKEYEDKHKQLWTLHR